MKRLLAVFTAVAALGISTVGNAGAQDVRTIPSSVASDCSKNVTAELKAFMSGTGARQLQPGGCYLVGPDSKTGIIGNVDGRGATIRRDEVKFGAPPERERHPGFFQIQTGGSLRNLNIERVGPGGYSEAHYDEHGVEVRGGGGTVVENIKLTNIRGDCIYIQGTNGATFRNIDCVSNGRQGGAISKGQNILIDGFKVRNSSRSGFDFEANSSDVSSTVANIEIRNFDFTTRLIAFPSQGYNAPQNNIHIHTGVVRKALSFVYDRQTRPSSDGCRSGMVRKNWRVENVLVDPSVGGYGGASAVFCGTENVTFRGVQMPGGQVLMEASRGRLEVSGSCLKSVKIIEPSAPVIQSGNTQPPCGSGPPPSTQPPVTTRPPTSTQPPTTQPPVTTRPPAELTAEQIAIRDAYIALRKVCAKETWC